MRLANLGGRATLVMPCGDGRGVDLAELSGGKFGIGTMRTRFVETAGGHDAG